MLFGCTALWGVSFPLGKALEITQRAALPPGTSSWFLAASSLTLRFGLGALVLLAWCWGSRRAWTREECAQGAGVGFFGGAGILFQMDGLARTDASTSAFLTAAYCVVLPLLVALRDRRAPGWRALGCCLLAAAGTAVLSRWDWQAMRLGRGETETLLASLCFAGQILWLERPRYAACRAEHSTLVMFGVTVAICLPVALASQRAWGEWGIAAAAPGAWALLLALALGCNLVTFTLMNHWQPHLPAVQAGLLYCAEPVWTGLFVLALPAWLAAWGGFAYQNEIITASLLLGGTLILLANVLVLLRPLQPAAP